MACSVEHVRPVLRPLLATPSPFANTVDGTASVLEGGAAAMLPAPAAPRSRMLPLVSTVPGTIWAMAASTLLGAGPFVPLSGFRAAAALKWATVFAPGAQLLSTSPGWLMISVVLAVPLSDLARTWLLLTMKVTPPRVISAPNVPEQHRLALVSVTLPPLVPILTGTVCCTWLSLGKTMFIPEAPILLASDCKVAVTVTECGEGNEVGAMKVAVLPLT